jgi:HlyD family secretion protein
MKKLRTIAIGLFILGGASWFAHAANQEAASGTAKKVTALGTIEPQEVVDVAAQVSGTIESLNVDWGTRVEDGTVLAKIESNRYAASVERAQAACGRAEAALNLAKIRAERAAAELKQSQELHDQKVVGDAILETARFAGKEAQASMAMAAAVVAESKADLHVAEIELANTTVRSPVKGVVIDRRVNRGQTVNSALNSPSLFLIGDIEKLQVWASVKEADIAKIHRQQSVHFTVDAFSGKVFEGTVTQIRLNATMLKDSVVYTVVIAVPKTEGLLPYMTAEVEFE